MPWTCTNRGDAVQVVMEGESTQLVAELVQPENGLNRLWQADCDQYLVARACKACAQKPGARQPIEDTGLALLDDMKGHPGMAAFREQGYDIITF